MTGIDDHHQDQASVARRTFLQQSAGLGLGLAALGLSGGAASAASASTSSGLAAAGGPRAARPLIIDALGGIDNPNLPQAERDDPRTMGIDARALADARAAGLSAFNMTVGYVYGDDDPYQQSIREVAAWDALLKVLKAADIVRARDSGRLGVILGFQNAAMMGEDAHCVDTFAQRGVRVIQLTYNGANQLGDGAMAPANRGLSP